MANTPFIVALTGGIASGKSTIEKFFLKLGVPIIDADKIAHEVVRKGKPTLNKLKDHFGSKIVDSKGNLNRSYLRKIIFNSPKERKWVNQLLHPIIHQTTQQQIESCRSPYLIWIVPLLIENNLNHYADRILVIESDPKIQLKRLKKRDNIDEKLAKNMLLSQVANEVRRSYADDIIENNDKMESLESRVFELHRKYLGLAKNDDTTRAS